MILRQPGRSFPFNVVGLSYICRSEADFYRAWPYFYLVVSALPRQPRVHVAVAAEVLVETRSAVMADEGGEEEGEAEEEGEEEEEQEVDDEQEA